MSIQSVAYGSLAFMGLLAHTCQMSMNGSRLSHFLYTVYFRDHNCQPVNWAFLIGQTVPIEPIMPDITHVASRTNIFALTYFVVSILWLVSSLMMIVGTCISCMGKCGYYLLFHPWIYITILNVILDAVATGFFIWDLVNSTVSWSSFLHHLEVSNASSLPNISDEYILAMPSVIMLCIAFRVLIFWILNIAFIPIVLTLGKKVIFGETVKAKRETVQLNPRPVFEQANPHNNNQMAYMIGTGVLRENGQNNESQYSSQNDRSVDTSRYSDPTAHQQSNIPEYSRPSQIVYPMTGRRRLEPLKGRESDDDSFTGKNGSKLDKQKETSPSIDKMSYLGEYEQKRLSIERPHLNSSKPSKLSDTIKETNNDVTKLRTDSRHSVNPPAELRGQLPWSYFKSRDDVTGPRKTFTQLREDEDAPPVPVPDYTLHFPKKDRPRTSSVNTDDGKWHGPEARY
ncbi:hypothetical protein Bhyg_07419 [Pseudolycoriella hygida]|uniref:Uncharacterized protein n=1 Tax=Pseudolycoriella hygida TaxID=35572 RepID=A0A9Q0N2K5_9DIPT|nr:hypothetical protein Bhyg_07419 [Pseudolycoriella hygida]